MKSEYLTKEHNKELIGKRARLKENIDYARWTYGKEGVIISWEDNPYLSLKFDKPHKEGYFKSNPMNTIFIRENSFILI